MNQQLIFDVVLYGIRAQGGPSVNGHGCVYRANDGKRCAVGMWISDADYSFEMEGRLVHALEEAGFKVSPLIVENKQLLSQLQWAHDAIARCTWGDVDKFFPLWESAMQTVAAKHNLVYTLPTSDLSQEVADLYQSMKEKDHDLVSESV